MKRIEKYSLEELRDKFLKLYDGKNWKQSNESSVIEFVSWCNEEIKTTPIIATINTVEELYKAEHEKNEFCRRNICNSCKLNVAGHPCLVKYLSEEIEVEE